MNNNEIEYLRTALEEANSLCRSAYSIAKRKGKETNWEAFEKRLEGVLDIQQEILHTPNHDDISTVCNWANFEEDLAEEYSEDYSEDCCVGIVSGNNDNPMYCYSDGKYWCVINGNWSFEKATGNDEWGNHLLDEYRIILQNMKRMDYNEAVQLIINEANRLRNPHTGEPT